MAPPVGDEEGRAVAGSLVSVRPRRPSHVAEVLRPAGDSLVLGAWLAGEAKARRHIEWFLREGRAGRPLLSGDGGVAGGGPRGAPVGESMGPLGGPGLEGRGSTG